LASDGFDGFGFQVRRISDLRQMDFKCSPLPRRVIYIDDCACIFNKSSLCREGDYAVRLGTLNKDDYEENRVQMDIPLDNIFKHEDYDADKLENDIALMKLPVAIALPKKPTDNCKLTLG
jgi:Trypsin